MCLNDTTHYTFYYSYIIKVELQTLYFKWTYMNLQNLHEQNWHDKTGNKMTAPKSHSNPNSNNTILAFL